MELVCFPSTSLYYRDDSIVFPLYVISSNGLVVVWHALTSVKKIILKVPLSHLPLSWSSCRVFWRFSTPSIIIWSSMDHGQMFGYSHPLPDNPSNTSFQQVSSSYTFFSSQKNFNVEPSHEFITSNILPPFHNLRTLSMSFYPSSVSFQTSQGVVHHLTSLKMNTTKK